MKMIRQAGFAGGEANKHLVLVAANGNRFPIYSVAHYAHSNTNFYLHPVASNDLYSSALLTDFNTLFPVGTKFTVVSDCAKGRCSADKPGIMTCYP